MNSSISFYVIWLMAYLSSKTALTLVTSAFFLNKEINLFTLWSWYSIIWVYLTKCYSYCETTALLVKYVALNWLNTLMFCPINIPVSVFFFLSFLGFICCCFYIPFFDFFQNNMDIYFLVYKRILLVCKKLFFFIYITLFFVLINW